MAPSAAAVVGKILFFLPLPYRFLPGLKRLSPGRPSGTEQYAANHLLNRPRNCFVHFIRYPAVYLVLQGF